MRGHDHDTFISDLLLSAFKPAGGLGVATPTMGVFGNSNSAFLGNSSSALPCFLVAFLLVVPAYGSASVRAAENNLCQLRYTT